MKLTLVVPTFNEGENVTVLTSTVLAALDNAKEQDYEILFVDDSSDNTPQILGRLSRENPKVRFIHRDNERGLGTAIVTGFHAARGEVLAVMDGDLQHPPSLLPSMLQLMALGYDLVIPSRFIPGGSDGGLSLPRKIVSFTARYLAKILLRRVRGISDPTGGFFMFRKEVIANIRFDAGSWKILIEILVRGRYARIAEIPYGFRARDLGTSKLSASAQVDYVRHLFTLFFQQNDPLPDPGKNGPAPPPARIDRIPG